MPTKTKGLLLLPSHGIGIIYSNYTFFFFFKEVAKLNANNILAKMSIHV